LFLFHFGRFLASQLIVHQYQALGIFALEFVHVRSFFLEFLNPVFQYAFICGRLVAFGNKRWSGHNQHSSLSPPTVSSLLTLAIKCLGVLWTEAVVAVVVTVDLTKQEKVLEAASKITCLSHTRSNHMMESMFLLISGS
jgi:hypothetical protein